LPLAFGRGTRLRGWACSPRRLSDDRASAVAAGVDQGAPSPPGLCLPWVSAPRVTASAVPLTADVSRHCQALTVLSRPAFQAVTRRVGRVLPVRCAVAPSRLCPSPASPGGAHAGVAFLEAS
jgi:hypothetical protein